jgi:hypothetical protein
MKPNFFLTIASMMGVLENPQKETLRVTITDSALSDGVLSMEVGIQNNTDGNASPLIVP